MNFLNLIKKPVQNIEIQNTSNFEKKSYSDIELNPEVRQQLSDFNENLSAISSMPDLFAKIVPYFSILSSELKQAREKATQFEELSKDEQGRNILAVSEINTLKDEIERLTYSVEREKVARLAESQKNIDQNGMLTDLLLTNADLNARLVRLEPLLRELKVTKDVLLNQLEKNEEESEIARKTIADHNSEILRLRDQTSNMFEANSVLNTAKQNLSDRLDQAMKDVFSRDNLLSSLREQVATLTTKVKREGIVANALRIENEQLIKEREDTRSQHENQLEGARSRYRITERLLEESRARFRSEAQMLTVLRREKHQSDNEAAQTLATMGNMKEEISGYRLQLIASSEMIGELNAKISDEAERRRKIEASNDVASEEIARLDTSVKAISLKSENDRLHYETTISELRGSIEAVRSENERLRSELSGYRFNQFETEANPDNAEDEKSSVVVKLGRN